MNKEFLDDPTPDNSYEDFWGRIKKLEEDSLRRIKKNERGKRKEK